MAQKQIKMTNNDKVFELSNGVFDEFTKNGLVLVDFFGEWCMPCVMMSSVIDEIADKFQGKIKVGKVNVDDNSELAKKFNIFSVPNFILFKEGKKIGQFIGSMSEEDFEEKLRKFL